MASIVSLPEGALLDLLAVKYSPPEWACFPFVRNGTGYTRPTTRTADAVAMNMWPSRGFAIHGFEVKVSRGDWLLELRHPEKAEEVFTFCDRWWLVAADETIVQPGELPTNWGLILPRGKTGLTVKVEAQPLQPVPIDRPFLAAVLRRAQETVTPQAKLVEAYKNGLRQGEKRAKDRVQSDYDDLRKMVEEFERASGVSLKDGWRSGQIGRAVKAVIDLPDVESHMEHLLQQAKGIVADMEETLKGTPERKSLRQRIVDAGVPS